MDVLLGSCFVGVVGIEGRNAVKIGFTVEAELIDESESDAEPIRVVGRDVDALRLDEDGQSFDGIFGAVGGFAWVAHCRIFSQM